MISSSEAYGKIQTDAIIDVIFGYYDANTYKNDTMDKLLYSWEKKKKYKHGDNCYKQHKHFSLFYLSVYDMLGKEALFVLTNLS